MSRRRQLYQSFGRGISPLAILALRAWTRLSGQKRARLIVVNEDDELLLVRGVISNGRRTLPGGGIERGESADAAAVRELHEETGIHVPVSRLKHVVTLTRQRDGMPYEAPIFYTKVKKSQLPAVMHNPREISSIEWWPLDALPSSVASVVPLALSALSKQD